MPIENQTPESANQGPEYGQTTRGFTRVLRAAEHCLRVFDPDPKTQIARAMLETRKDAHLAELSFDDIRKRVRLTVTIRKQVEMTPTRSLSFLAFQEQTNIGIAFVTFDGNRNFFKIRAQAPLPHPILSASVLPPLVMDTREILESERFNMFLR